MAMTAEFFKALNVYIKRLGTRPRHKLVIMDGRRYVKIAWEHSEGGRSAICFVDKKKGWSYGNVSEAASWSQPRKYWSTNIFGRK